MLAISFLCAGLASMGSWCGCGEADRLRDSVSFRIIASCCAGAVVVAADDDDIINNFCSTILSVLSIK